VEVGRLPRRHLLPEAGPQRHAHQGSFGPVIDSTTWTSCSTADHAMARSTRQEREFRPSPAEGPCTSSPAGPATTPRRASFPRCGSPPTRPPGAAVLPGRRGGSGRADDHDQAAGRDRRRHLQDRQGQSGRRHAGVPFGAYQEARFAAFGSLLQFGKPPQQNAAGEWYVDINALAATWRLLRPRHQRLQLRQRRDQAPAHRRMFLDASRRWSRWPA